MPRFEPFRAVRYDHTCFDLNEVAAPPYDVLSESDIDELTDRNTHNIVRIDVPREQNGPGRYDTAASTYRQWLSDSVLVTDEQPSFTIYRMSFTDEAGTRRQTVGVIGGLEVVDEGAGGVLPHERTTPKAKTDRLDLTRTTEANLSPVWGLSLTAGLSALLEAAGDPVGSMTVDGVTHSVERVNDPARVTDIANAVNSQPVVIADGHHRYAISRTYRDEVRAQTGETKSPAELTMTYVAELVEEQLSIEAIHRLYLEVKADALLSHLGARFELEPAGPVEPAITLAMADRGSLCFVDTAGAGTWMTPKAGAFEGIRDLDSMRLEHALADFPHEVTYQHGVGHVVEALNNGRAVAGVLIRPVGIAEIRRTADEGLLMPPKSTFFTPKLRTGLVIRPLV